MLHMKSGFDWPMGFRGEDLLILWQYTCILPQGGADLPPGWGRPAPGVLFFRIINLQPICPLHMGMIGQSPRCYIPSFVEICPPVPEMKIFCVFFNIDGHGGHLGHVTLAIYLNFHSSFQRMLHMKSGFDWPRGFRGEDL